MPTVSLDRQDLFDIIGPKYSNEEALDELCFQYGLELDEWGTEDQQGERPTVKIEVPANRYDMLCVEGISRALAIYLGKEKAPKYKLVVPKTPLELTIEPEVAKVRPYAAAAVVRGLKFTPRRYASFIALQDKLHSNICRNRSLVAIGTHDLSKVKGNLRYRALPPKDIKFKPLNQAKEMTGPELIEHYKGDRGISKFLPLIEDSPVYPLFVDEDDQVLSLPPIINSDRTKITLDTTDVFFDLTATDETKLNIVLNQMVTMFAEYTDEPFTIEAVKINYPSGKSTLLPDLSERTMTAEVAYLNAVLGLEYTAAQYAELLEKMSLNVTCEKNGELLKVDIPVTRPDILHQCDIVEDAGVAYGFNNLEKAFPGSAGQIAKPLPINRVGDILRREAAQSGWTEVMPLTLSSIAENFEYLGHKLDDSAVHLANPKTLEYQVVRTTLLPGILKTIKENRNHALPIKVFECGEVCFKDTTQERQARNERHFAAVYAGTTSGFEIAQGLLDRLCKMMRYSHGKQYGERGYWLEATDDDKTFYPGRGARIFLAGKPIGRLGVIHPDVAANFDIPFVCSGFEIDARVFL